MTEERNPGTHCMVLTGFQGDTNHINVFLPKKERGKGYEHSEKMGRIIADAVELAWDKVEMQTDDTLRCEVRDVFVKSNMNGIEYFEECREFVEKHREDMGENGAKYTPSGIIYYEASCIAGLPDRPAIWRVSVPMMAIGKVVLIGFPGEPYTQIGRRVKAGSPFAITIPSCNTNGWVSYIPTREAIPYGGLGVDTDENPDIEDICVNSAIELAKELKSSL
jgi:hypothetical protein